MAVNCVFPNKKQAESLGITEGQLRNILQEYTNSQELQSQFTEEEFIDSKLNGLPVIGVSDTQMQAWEEVYSTPQEFDNVDDYNEAASTAEAIFGKDAIGHRETPEGKHILSVANPYTESMVKERLEIKDKAIKDETFMKAPNGNPTNLTERQWLQVRTKEFKDWFGDWENDPENASKVVDENGEPLIVYHGGSKVNVFDTSGRQGRGAGIQKGDIGAYFTTNKDSAKNYEEIHRYKNSDALFDIIDSLREQGMSEEQIDVEWETSLLGLRSDTRPFFLNIKNPKRKLYTKETEGYTYIDENANETNDGQAIQRTDVKEVEWVVFNPNQIKSADKNIGSFSREEDNINLNKDLKEGTFLSNLVNHPLAYNYFERVGDKVKLKGDRIESLKALKMYVESRELPSDYIGVTKEGYLYEKTEKYPLEDQIKAYEDSEDLFESAEQQEQAMQVLEFLKEKTGLNFKFINENKAKELLNGKSIDGVNAFVKGDTAYFIKSGNRKFNTDIASEEMLHPFVASIRKENVDAFESLRKDARRAFPVLSKQIESTYKSDVEEEIVTQALSRAFRKDYEENSNHNVIKDLLTKFWNYIKGWFRNSGDMPIFDGTDRLFARDLSETITIENLAKLINSDLLLGNANSINRTALNEESEEHQLIRKENQRGQQRSLDRQVQLNALRNNEVGLTQSEILYEARQLSYWITDSVTDIQLHPEKMYDKFGVAKTNDWATDTDKKKDIDAVSKMSRRQIISKITLNKFRDIYQTEMFEDNPAIDNLKGRDTKKLPVLRDNVSGLFDMALSTFAESEGFSITYNDKLGTEEIVDNGDDTVFIDDDMVDLAQLAEEGVKLEDWMIDKESMDILGTASAQVRAVLSQAFETDAEGREKVDYLGRKIRLSTNDAVKSIIRWTQGSQNVNDMIKMLDEKAYNHSWLIQILDRLEDTENETDFISQFYTTFQKHFVLYDIIKKSNKGNRYFFMDVNNRPALNAAMNEVMVNYQLGLSPLFTSRGYNQNNLSWFKRIVDGLKQPDAYNAIEEQFNAKKGNFTKVISGAARLLGYYITDENVHNTLTYQNYKKVIDNLKNILDAFDRHPNADNGNYNPFAFSRDVRADSVYGYLKDFLSTITESVEDTMESSFYEAGKMRQSYQLPAYITKLFGKLQGNGELFRTTLETEFMPYEWFYKDGVWKNSMLRDIATKSPEERKELLVYKRNLKFGKDQYMRGMSQERYGLSVLTEFAAAKDVNGVPVAFYRIPIQSNKASSDFVSFYRYTDKRSILDNLMLTFGQELSRMQTVILRDKHKGDKDFIENFDESRGRQFCFLDFLNDPQSLVNRTFTEEAAQEFSKLIDAKVHGEEVNNIRLNELARQAVESGMDRAFIQTYNRFESLGMMEAIKKIEGVIDRKSGVPQDVQVQRFIENFVWNDTLASINLTQLLVTDLAFYKDSDDFQKRFAQVHAPGVRGNEFAVVYRNFNGTPNRYAISDGRVSDGRIRAMFLNDYKSFVANMIDNLEIVLDRNIEAAPKNARGTYRALKTNILSSMRKINVTDGQSLISPTAARKFGYMYGKWSREQEEAYERVTQGNYSLNDLIALTNVRKPFVYTQLNHKVSVKDSEGNEVSTPLTNLKVGTQIKDSEYMLVLAGALLRNADTGIPNFLKVLYDVMEESAFDENGYNGKGIDIFAFDSTVKTGLTGSSDVSVRWANKNYTKEGKVQAENELKDYLLSQVYMTDDNGLRVYDQYRVKEIPAEDYATQVENPFHTLDERVIWGSQMRAILESNLAYSDSEGAPVMFSWTDSEGQEHSVNRDEFRQAYEQNASDLIEIFVNRIDKEFGLGVNGNPATNFADQRVAISLALQEEIMKNIERYGIDLLDAVSVDENGKFVLPPGDPTNGKRVAQLVNSIVKNRLNKPKVDGGMAVQVSSFGTSDQLHIRFFAKDGKTLLPTKEEWLKSNPNGDYKAYCKENQGGVAYEENYAPAHMGEFFRYFTDWNGNVDVEAIEMLDENLLFSIDERTPTEFYYSISVAKIKDFLPKEAGDGFMRPYEITEIDDSDFDNDKQAKWKLSANIVKNKERFGVKELINAVPALQKMSRRDAKRIAQDFLDGDIFQKSDSYQGDKALFRAMKEAYIKGQFTVEYPTEGEKALINNSWRMSLAVLQSESNAAKLLSPGGNADLARQGYLIQSAVATGRSYDELNTLSDDELKNIAKKADRNIMFFTNQMEYYKRNNDASSNLGIFAVAATSHNLLEGQMYAIGNNTEFTIAGKHFGYVVELDPMMDEDGMLVSKSLGANVSGAADAAKVPSHAFLNVNGNTINEYLILLRTGMPMYKAATFIATQPLKELVGKLNSSNVQRNTVNMKTLLGNRIAELIREMKLDQNSPLFGEELSWEEIKQAVNNPTKEIELKVLLAFQRLGNLTDGMRAFTSVTRYNSIASAVGPQITDNLRHEHQENKYGANNNLAKIEYVFKDATDNNTEKKFGDIVTDKNGKKVVLTPNNFKELEEQGVLTVEDNTRQVSLGEVKDAHPMLKSFSKGYDLVREMFNVLQMPIAQEKFRNVITNSLYEDFFFANEDGLNKFSEFYLSYLLVRSGIINSDPNLKTDGPRYYIREFPQKFLSIRENYRGNALIDAIHPRIDDGVVSLALSTSGLKIDTKTELQSAWLELYNKDKKLALDLFKYNFWRGGLGFSPKTFMNLVPSQIKKELEGYYDTFTKNSPSVTMDVVDQFFRNNAKDNNLIRFISNFVNGTYRYDFTNDSWIEFNALKYDELKGSPYIKWKDKTGNIVLFGITERDDTNKTLRYEKTTALGNNGEFLEISNRHIKDSIIESKIADTGDEHNNVSEVPDVSRDRTEEQMQREAEEYAGYFKDANGNMLKGTDGRDLDAATLVSQAMRAKRGEIILDNAYISSMRSGIEEVFKVNNVPYSESKVKEIIKKFC